MKYNLEWYQDKEPKFDIGQKIYFNHLGEAESATIISVTVKLAHSTIDDVQNFVGETLAICSGYTLDTFVLTRDILTTEVYSYEIFATEEEVTQ